MSDLEQYLSQFDESVWLETIDELQTCIHEVDQNAVRIWFRFYPLSLRRFIDSSEDKEKTLAGIAMLGEYRLEDHIDDSHIFLYGHRYWRTVKAAIKAEAAVFSGQKHSLIEEIKQIAMLVAEKLKLERPLVNAIVAVGLATLAQVGLEAFEATPGDVEKPTGVMAGSPEKIIANRKRDDSQGLLGFLRTVDKRFSVAFIGVHQSGTFPVINDEELASASQRDNSRDWQSIDSRCWQGPVPIECTAASCGTCWVGILGGQEKLSEVGPRERRQMQIFGYDQPEDARPFLRLACQARAAGNVTIAIAPWNAVYGKKVYGNIEDVELEPVTTSAKALRDTIASATAPE